MEKLILDLSETLSRAVERGIVIVVIQTCSLGIEYLRLLTALLNCTIILLKGLTLIKKIFNLSILW